jgi:hypothetical protein
MAAPDRESCEYITRYGARNTGTKRLFCYFAQVKLAAEFGSPVPLYFADCG